MFSFSQKTDALDWFDSKESKAEILSIYQKQLARLNKEYKEHDITTTFGQTHVIEVGKPTAPTLVLLHGTNASAAAILEAFKDLTNHFHVYAVDVIGQPNKSNALRPKLKSDGYGDWMNQVMQKLNISNSTLMGVSFGGFICTQTAKYDTSRIKNLVLVSPGGIAQGSMFKMYNNAFVPMKKFKQTKADKYFNEFTASSITDASELTLKMMKIILLHYTIDTTPIPKIKKRDAQKINIPIYLFSSNQDIFFPAQKVVKRSQKIFPNLTQHYILKNSLHVPSEQDTKLIINELKKID